MSPLPKTEKDPLPKAEKDLIDIAKATPTPDLAVVRELLPAIKNINAANSSNGFTALHWAVVNGHADLVELLVMEAGANIDALNRPGATPAYLAGSSIGSNNPERESKGNRKPIGVHHDSIYRYLLSKGAHYHQLDTNSPKANEEFRERWFTEASDSWHRWTENTPAYDVTTLTPKKLLQFTSHGKAEIVLNPNHWRGHEAALRTLLASPQIPPCHIQRWMSTIPGLSQLVQPSTPTPCIEDWIIDRVPAPSRSSTR